MHGLNTIIRVAPRDSKVIAELMDENIDEKMRASIVRTASSSAVTMAMRTAHHGKDVFLLQPRRDN